jgi:hypothetical protein
MHVLQVLQSCKSPHSSPLHLIIYQKLNLQTLRGQTGKDANLALFCGAFKACVAGGKKGQGCLFRTLFLWLLSFGGAKESDN